MANICSNIFKVTFLANSIIDRKSDAKNLVNSLIELLPSVDLITDIDDEYFDNSIEIEFTSRWSAPKDIIEEQSIKYNCKFIGVSYEFANDYVDVFIN